MFLFCRPAKARGRSSGMCEGARCCNQVRKAAFKTCQCSKTPRGSLPIASNVHISRAEVTANRGQKAPNPVSSYQTMARYTFATVLLSLVTTCNPFSHHPPTLLRPPPHLSMSSEQAIDYNSVYVPKSGGTGVKSASEMMNSAPRSLGAPPPRRPRGGSFLTRGGVNIDAHVRELRYTHGQVCDAEDDDCYVSSFFEESGKVWGSEGAIERLIDLLDERRGAVLTSGYEFPGR